MEIIPAINILDGKCVALYKGDFEQYETYYDGPIETAKKYEHQGADKLYIVDLNGLQKSDFLQKEIVEKLIKKVKIPIILESGFNTQEDITEALKMGVDYIVLRSPDLDYVKTAIDHFGPEKIMIQLFARRSELIEKREKKYADDITDVVEYAEKLIPLGVKNVIYKDKSSEGTLIHPNYDEIDRLYLITGESLKIYSSGGISDTKHLKMLQGIGAAGAIIGKALFENMLSIRQAEETVNDHTEGH